jgi:hypothetical protein
MQKLAITIVGIFISLFFIFNKVEGDSEVDKKNEIFNITLNKIINKLEDKYKLIAIGSGGGSRDGKYKNMSLAFERYGPFLDLEASRCLIVEAAKDFLKEANSNLELEKYFNSFPLTEKNIKIDILNKNKDGSNVLDPHIGFISLRHEDISYMTMDNEADFVTTVTENYTDALGKVKN